jgi:anti-sigma B factor antagonist
VSEYTNLNNRYLEPVWIEGEWACVHAPGALDYLTQERARSYLIAAAATSPTGNLAVYLGNTAFCDSAGLGLLIGARKRAAARGARVALVATPPLLLERLALTGLKDCFELVQSIAELTDASSRSS